VAQQLNLNLSEEELDRLVRSVSRGYRMLHFDSTYVSPLRRSAAARESAGSTSSRDSTASAEWGDWRSHGNLARRRPSNLVKRGDTLLTVQVHYEVGPPGCHLRTTRSIGDWDGSRVCIALPEVRSFQLPRGSASRFILASDGLWDIFKPKRVAKRVHQRGKKSALALAQDLISWVVGESQHRYSLLRDDVSILVVDVGDVAAVCASRGSRVVGSSACSIL